MSTRRSAWPRAAWCPSGCARACVCMRARVSATHYGCACVRARKHAPVHHHTYTNAAPPPAPPADHGRAHQGPALQPRLGVLRRGGPAVRGPPVRGLPAHGWVRCWGGGGGACLLRASCERRGRCVAQSRVGAVRGGGTPCLQCAAPRTLLCPLTGGCGAGASGVPRDEHVHVQTYARVHAPTRAGRDVSNGTYRMDAVSASFVRAARKLEAMARGRSQSDTSVNYLQVRG